jgi:MFS family permease
MKPRAGLWGNGDFVRLWTAQSVSQLGSMMGALSLTALVYLDASASQMGLLAAAAGLPVLLFALFAGVWIDRVPRRPLLIASDLGRAALLATVPLAAVFGDLSIEQLMVVAFLVGVLELAFAVAQRSYLPSLVAKEELIEANSRMQASESAMEVGGPAVGGMLVQALSGPAAVAIDAATFVGSAVALATMRSKEAPPAPGTGPSLLRDAMEGLRAVRGHELLRPVAVATVCFGFFGGFWHSLYTLFGVRELGLSPAAVGVTIGAGGLGSLAGAVIAGRLARRIGLGGAMALSRVAMAPTGFVIALAGGPMWLAFATLILAQLLGDVFWGVYDIASVSLRQSVTPDRLLGRVNASFYLLGAGVLPIGALAAGWLAEAIGARETLLVASCGGLVGDAWLVLSPVRRFRGDEAQSAPAPPAAGGAP